MPDTSDLIAVIDSETGLPIGWRSAGRPPRFIGAPIVLDQRANAGTLLTGTTAETTLESIVIPGGLLGPGSSMRLMALYSFTGTNGTRTLKAKVGANHDLFGAVVIASNILSTTKMRDMFVRDGGTVISFGAWSEYGTNVSANVTNALDMSVDQVLTLSVQLASAADSARLEAWRIEVFAAE